MISYNDHGDIDDDDIVWISSDDKSKFDWEDDELWILKTDASHWLSRSACCSLLPKRSYSNIFLKTYQFSSTFQVFLNQSLINRNNG